jgi:SpoVK/Ycf46/Vps4 family AAA+-type ATPase
MPMTWSRNMPVIISAGLLRKNRLNFSIKFPSKKKEGASRNWEILIINIERGIAQISRISPKT